jgi:hypothetical protein
LRGREMRCNKCTNHDETGCEEEFGFHDSQDAIG